MSGDLVARSAQVITRCDIHTGYRWSEGVLHYQVLAYAGKLAMDHARVIKEAPVARSSGPAYRGGHVRPFTSPSATPM